MKSVGTMIDRGSNVHPRVVDSSGTLAPSDLASQGDLDTSGLASARISGWSLLRRRLGGETGAVTAEYAITTMAAVAFAGLLVVILRSDQVRELLLGMVRSALQIPV